jgi:2-furoyl-CoA dehydrogenase FAD binding subunit
VKPAAFKYVRADSIEEALSVLAKYGEDVRVMAGGQSLGALLNMRIVTPPIVLDINRIFVLSQI